MAELDEYLNYAKEDGHYPAEMLELAERFWRGMDKRITALEKVKDRHNKRLSHLEFVEGDNPACSNPEAIREVT